MHDEEIDKIWTYPRIYVESPLNEGETIQLSTEHAHYFKNVLRRQDGNFIRLFNGKDGEWVATLDQLTKKSGAAILKSQSRKQPENPPQVKLYFAPIKKSRMDILIEKVVELGVTHLIPVITARTENRKLKSIRIEKQILEAAEQCERLEIPHLNESIPMTEVPKDETIYACIERKDDTIAPLFISEVEGNNLSFLVGPEGGFTDQEIETLAQSGNIKPVTLGERIYRAETASIICLTHASINNT